MKLEIKDISKSFGDVEILHDVSFSVKTGRALGLLGRNGAGKTTTIRIIMDVFRANSGEILLDGEKFNISKHLVGYLPEERGLYPKKVVIDQLIYLAQLRGMSAKAARKSADKWLAKLEVSEYTNRKLDTLSKGNQQKVQLAATLVGEPEIVILDEPFSGLDPVNAQILKNVVREIIDDNKLVIFSSHQMSYVEEFCEDIAIINAGEVVLSGNLDEIKEEYGKSRKILSAENLELDALETLCKGKMYDLVEVVGRTKHELIILFAGETTQWDVLDKLKSEDISIKKFGSYEPSLNDIFVSKVGEEIESLDEDKEEEDKTKKKQIKLFGMRSTKKEGK